MSSDTERAIEEILNDFERQPLQDKRTFRAYLSQPELISLSSTNAQIASPPISPLIYAQYYNFTVNLPRPALDAKSLQLLKAVVPQAQCSIPDYSLVFPYYKLRTLPISDAGTVQFIDTPSYGTLYFVRLLPSYYKKELLSNLANTIDDYGFNRTFYDYEELEKELNKACKKDISFTDLQHYLENDVSFTYDKTTNKFIFNGLKAGVANTYPTFNIAVSYPKDAVVSYSGDNYIALQNVPANYNFPPAEPLFWLPTNQFQDANVPRNNAYLIAGYDDPLVKILLEDIKLYSTVNDFAVAGISSIPGNQNVDGQTLARRMGFTWDGNGMRTSDINDYFDATSRVPFGSPFGGTQALFYNRLRVVPYYQPLPPLEEELGAALSRVSYTADGYCNLVYSSIISIYTTIVGTSSVDTQRNANLLATIEMDCGNLGVAMVGNYIDTKLTKIQGDIYSIYIELRDENGQPYYLTNNATTTLLIKLTYD